MYIWTSRVMYTKESCHTYERVGGVHVCVTQESQVSHIDESCHVYMDALCRVYEGVMSHMYG